MKYFDLSFLIYNSENFPKKLKINKEKIIYLNKAYIFNNSTIQIKDNKYLSAVRVFGNEKSPFKIKKDGFIHLPSMWHNSRYIHLRNNKELTKETFYDQKTLEYKTFGEGWNGYSFVIVFIHDHEKIYRSTIFNNGSLINEDPRLYIKSNGNIYMYYITRKDLETCEAISGKKHRSQCVVIDEIRVTIENTKNIIKFADKKSILCNTAHKYKDKFGIIFEKNFCPFVYNNYDYVSYQIEPFIKIYKRDGEKCIKKTRHTTHSIFEKMKMHIGPCTFSQTSPGIKYKNSILAIGHFRVKFSDIDKILDKSIKKFMNSLLLNFENGEIMLHTNIYLTFLYTFKLSNDNAIIENFSNPFLFDYTNRKFCLDFCTTINRTNNGEYLLSFGQGDVLCLNAFLTEKEVEKLLDNPNNDFKPFYLNGEGFIQNSKYTLQNVIEQSTSVFFKFFYYNKILGIDINNKAKLFPDKKDIYDTETIFTDDKGWLKHVASGLYLCKDGEFRKKGEKIDFKDKVLKKYISYSPNIFKTDKNDFHIDDNAQQTFKKTKLDSLDSDRFTNNHHAIILCGSTGSGKSFTIKNIKDAVFIDYDDIILEHPNFPQNNMDYTLYKKMYPYISDISESMYKKALNKGLAMIIQAPLPNKDRITELEKNGYKVTIMFKDEKNSIADERRYKRMMKTHLYAPIQHVNEKDIKKIVGNNYKKI